MFARKINLTDQQGRNAIVGLQSCRKTPALKEQTSRHVRLLKSGLEYSLAGLQKRFGTKDAIGQALINGDPEIDFESAGKETGVCRRVYLDADNQPLYSAHIQEIAYGTAGEELRREEPNYTPSDFLEQKVWSGKLIPIHEAVRRFAFTRKYAVRHVDRLTFDFLHDLAAWLGEKKSMVLIGSGPKGSAPLIFERGALPLIGMLSGAVKEENYRLQLHLASFELKRPES